MEHSELIWVDANQLHHHKVNFAKAYKYAQAMDQGDDFPPIKVYIDAYGRWLVADGAHRSAAGKMLETTVLVQVTGRASDEEDYGDFHRYKPEAKDFWYKQAKKF